MFKMIREKAILEYCKAFSVVNIKAAQKIFGIINLEEELVNLILAKKLNGKIDSFSKTLQKRQKEGGGERKGQQHFLSNLHNEIFILGKTIRKNVQQMQLYSSIIQNKIKVEKT
jgi:hypothetical protein